MSNDRRSSRPPSYRQEQEYYDRRRDSAPRSNSSSRSGARDYDSYDRYERDRYDRDRPRSSERSGSRPSGSRPSGGSGGRPANGNRPANGGRPSGNAPARRPVKRKRRRIPVLPILFLIALLAIIVLLVHSCTGKEPQQSGTYELEFLPGNALIVGDTGQVNILGLPADFAGTVLWTSGDDNVLEIENGVMKAKNPGSSLVAAIIDGETISNTVVVHPVPENVKDITLNYPDAATILSGTTLQLEATITLDDGTTPSGLPVNWITSNPGVASVTYDGLVTGRDVGTAAITAKLGNQTAVCMVTVQKNNDGTLVESSEGYGDPNATGEGEGEGTPETAPETTPETTPPTTPETTPPTTPETTTPPAQTTPPATTGGTTVSTLIISQKSGNLDVGGSLVLGATVSPSNASVSWVSSNPSVATVSPEGVVTAVGAGDAIITAMAGSLTAHCSVHVEVGSGTAGGEDGVPDPGHP